MEGSSQQLLSSYLMHACSSSCSLECYAWIIVLPPTHGMGKLFILISVVGTLHLCKYAFPESSCRCCEGILLYKPDLSQETKYWTTLFYELFSAEVGPTLLATILMMFIDTVMNIHKATLFEIAAGGNTGIAGISFVKILTSAPPQPLLEDGHLQQ